MRRFDFTIPRVEMEPLLNVTFPSACTSASTEWSVVANTWIPYARLLKTMLSRMYLVPASLAA